MKKWLKRKLTEFLNSPDEPRNYGVAISKASISSNDGIDMDNSLRFNVLVGAGGVVLQIYRYDRKNDRSNNSTHIIPENENISERIGQIVALEILKG
jgi:hypothetical protein